MEKQLVNELISQSPEDLSATLWLIKIKIV